MDMGFWIPLLVFVVITVAICMGIVLIGTFITEKVCVPLLKEISKMGYDAQEVRIFCRRIGASLEDFIASKGLQKQYELFRNGETSEFIKTSESKVNADKARSEGQATGMATGMAVGMSINAGN